MLVQGVQPHTNFVEMALSEPEKLCAMDLAEWDLLIRQARPIGVLGTIHHKLTQLHLLENVPEGPRRHLESAFKLASFHRRVLRWEVYCVGKVLADVCNEMILLKGAAYMMSEMHHARGRLQSDLDILVPEARLDAVETALIRNGWTAMKVEKYDQFCYRQWGHELPPLLHSERHTVLDVHHNILPRTSRLKPDSSKLLAAAQMIPGTVYRRLSDTDMLLHASAHLFHDGEVARGLRELSDVDGLIRTFAGQSGFWDGLMRRAPEMDLQRPMFYALRYAAKYLRTPVPGAVLESSAAWSPSHSVVRAMDRLVSEALDSKLSVSYGNAAARWLLYARSHWLRMPPLLLARHLAHQSFRRAFPHRKK